MMDEQKKSATPVALFGLFPQELNQQILDFRQREFEAGHLEQSDNFMTLPHFTLAWSPDFDFKQSAALKHVVNTRVQTAFNIIVEKVDFAGEDIAIYFDRDQFRLIIKELGHDLDAFQMDVVFTDHIKLLKTPIVPEFKMDVLEKLKEMLPDKIMISRLGFGGKLLREEDLEWTLPMPYDPIFEDALKFRKFHH
jgi:hypothetical protein